MQLLNVTEQLVDKPAKAMTYGGGASSVTAWALSWPDIAAIVGAVVAIVGLSVQIWATRRRDRREEALFWKRMEGGDDDE